MVNGYALRMHHPDSWTVFDVFTGQPAEFDDKATVGINAGDAEEILDQLNSRDAKRRKEAGRTY